MTWDVKTWSREYLGKHMLIQIVKSTSLRCGAYRGRGSRDSLVDKVVGGACLLWIRFVMKRFVKITKLKLSQMMKPKIWGQIAHLNEQY